MGGSQHTGFHGILGSMSNPLRLAVLLSGSGRSLANLLEYIAAGDLSASVETVISNRPDARGVKIAEASGIDTHILSRGTQSAEQWSTAVFDICRDLRADLVVMAGFLQHITIPEDFQSKVINIHPSLLPSFGGKGFHGMHVHRAVLERGCTVSGCTVHFVDNEYDHGRILLQETVRVLPDDSPETLAARVFAAECVTLPKAIRRVQMGLS
jgi:formyltetrahydrofolate-dependent phosphoribosylglycinamide formyltransferase